MSSTTPTILFDHTSFAWPDGTLVLNGTTAAFGPGRTGLIGDNGTGKTTVLRLIAGELRPTAGAVTTSGEVGYLAQHPTLATDARVADLLGVRGPLDALRAIEAGEITPARFEAVGDDWDIEGRAEAALGALGLAYLDLDRLWALSGGEVMLVALTGLRLAETPIVLLDEPTNNLDRDARERLYDASVAWPGALVVVNHDVDLLDLMNETVELHGNRLSVFGGGFSEYAEALAQEQAAAAQALRSAEQDLKKEQRQRREAETKLARRQRYANTDFVNKRKPKAIMNTRRFEAQVSAGKLRGVWTTGWMRLARRWPSRKAGSARTSGCGSKPRPEQSGRSWHGSCSVSTTSTGRSRHSPEANASGSRWRGCCWLTRRIDVMLNLDESGTLVTQG